MLCFSDEAFCFFILITIYLLRVLLQLFCRSTVDTVDGDSTDAMLSCKVD